MDELPEDRETDQIEVPLEALRQINDLCDEFEARLRAGGRPDLPAFLARAPEPTQGKLLYELVALVLEDAGTSQRTTRLKELAEAHPELADEIATAAESFGSDARTAVFQQGQPNCAPPATPRRRRSRGLRLRCPHCSNHVELLADTPIDSVNCDTCGSNFSLVNRSIETRMAEALERIDRFELVSRLGVGGFGTVWKARDTDLDRPVAIKIPRHGQLSPEETEQFFREARAVAQLRHPNIVPVHEVGREGDTVFIVSDLVRGISLADELSGPGFSPREAAELCVKLALALAHAHDAGIVHRDLKPSNVMLDEQGEPVLMDFGLAKREAEEVTMTVDGAILGTPAYMSPEQAEGRSALADKRSDVYSLGVIIFELLTGGLPFQGNAQRQVQARLREDAPDVRSRNSHLPRDLAAITAKCLERKPGRRYQSANAVAAELGRFLSGRTVNARPVSPLERARRWMVRHPIGSALATTVLLLAIAGPTTAVIIESQRARLADLLDQKNGLIAARATERAQDASTISDLRRQIDTWRGKSDPFDLWGPAGREPPRRRSLASLLAARERDLLSPEDERSSGPIDRARRHLALAAAYEVMNRQQEARDQLVEAVETLEPLLPGRQPEDGLRLAVADACLRIAALTPEKLARTQWLARAARLSRGGPPAGSTEPLALSLRLQALLLNAAEQGYAGGQQSIQEAIVAKQALDGSWPESHAEVYRIACQLAGRVSYLPPDSAAGKDLGE